MTTIHPLSDLHLEFWDYTPPNLDADIVILAGDINLGTEGLFWARETFPDSEIIFVAGNHEFYHHHYQDLLGGLRAEAKQLKIHFLENDEVIIHGIRFLGCTLWTDYKCSDYCDQFTAMRILNTKLVDHEVIKMDDKQGQFVDFSTKAAWSIHTDSVVWLTEKLFDENFDGKTVVVTHHAPSRLCEHKVLGANELSPAFISDLPHLVAKADLWIYGHTHSNLDIMVGKTRLLANQRGYPGLRDNISDFNERLILEL